MRFSYLYFPINFLFLTIGIFITLYNILNINLYKGNKKGRLLINQNKNYILNTIIYSVLFLAVGLDLILFFLVILFLFYVFNSNVTIKGKWGI